MTWADVKKRKVLAADAIMRDDVSETEVKSHVIRRVRLSRRTTYKTDGFWKGELELRER